MMQDMCQHKFKAFQQILYIMFQASQYLATQHSSSLKNILLATTQSDSELLWLLSKEKSLLSFGETTGVWFSTPSIFSSLSNSFITSSISCFASANSSFTLLFSARRWSLALVSSSTSMVSSTSYLEDTVGLLASSVGKTHSVGTSSVSEPSSPSAGAAGAVQLV